MKFRHFAPLDRDVSSLVLGTAVLEHANYDESIELLDAWLALGGNAIDTGRQYGNAESILGRWLRERDAHDDVIVITKGGHHDEITGRPRLTAPDLAADLDRSRRELGLDTIDLYLLHRDDPQRPAPEIMEDLRPLIESRRVRSLGASNWTIARLEAAAEYAGTHSMPAFSCSSPNLSLAVANEPPWPGCISIHRPAEHAWYTETQLPVFAWQALAGGFFADVSNSDLDRVYASGANVERLRRAQLLAQEHACTPSQVALAWAVGQPFPVYAIIGPRTIFELRDCVEALELELSADELGWLDLQQANGPPAISAHTESRATTEGAH